MQAWGVSMANRTNTQGILYMKCSLEELKTRLVAGGCTEEVADKKLNIFKDQTIGCVNTFAQGGQNVWEVQAGGTQDEVYAEIQKVVNDLMNKSTPNPTPSERKASTHDAGDEGNTNEIPPSTNMQGSNLQQPPQNEEVVQPEKQEEQVVVEEQAPVEEQQVQEPVEQVQEQAPVEQVQEQPPVEEQQPVEEKVEEVPPVEENPPVQEEAQE